MIDPAWEGKVQFYELIYGTWLSYIFLTLLFEKVLRQPLQEWRYVLLNFIGASAFWVNHYFQGAPFYSGWTGLLSLYTYMYLGFWYWFGVRGHGRSVLWQVGAMLCAILYTIGFIGFEYIARIGVEDFGYSEFWFMLGAWFGFVFVIIWRGNRRSQVT